MVLSWSRAIYVEFVRRADVATFIRCHINAFAYFDGVPRRSLYDNAKVMVLGRDDNGRPEWNQRFVDFALDKRMYAIHARSASGRWTRWNWRKDLCRKRGARMAEMNSRQLARTWSFKRYKAFERELRDATAEWFSKRGLATHTRMRYCLESHDSWPQNIICTDVAEYIRQEHERRLGEDSFPLHKYLHHGLSSQAMVFNLVGPLIVRKDFEPLRVAIERAGMAWPTGKVTAGFEYDDRAVFNEDSGQPTSIDLVISGEAERIFIEAKLVEREFGGCSVFSGGDCDGRNPISYGFDGCYLHHIGRKYWERMDEFGFGETVFASGPICPFANYYQFFREVLFSLKKGGCFILLHDERNPAFLKVSKDGKESGLWPFLIESVPAEHAADIGRITIQQLVNAIDESGRHHDWINEFKLKYGIAGDRHHHPHDLRHRRVHIRGH